MWEDCKANFIKLLFESLTNCRDKNEESDSDLNPILINFSNKKDPIIESNSINHKIKLKYTVINFLHGDLVEFEILNRKRKGFYMATIISLIKREKNEYVGIIQVNKNFAFAIVDSNFLNFF